MPLLLCLRIQGNLRKKRYWICGVFHAVGKKNLDCVLGNTEIVK